MLSIIVAVVLYLTLGFITAKLHMRYPKVGYTDYFHPEILYFVVMFWWAALCLIVIDYTLKRL